MIAILSLLLLSTVSHAKDQNPPFEPFYDPPNILKATKYANDCGGVSEDLSPDMPPVDDQGPAGWCATFSARALLEYAIHRANPGDAYQNRISPVDLNTWDTSLPENLRGKFVNARNGTDVFEVLEGAQGKGALYSENDLPFDPNLFSDANIMTRLSAYYDEEKPFAEKGELACRNQSSEDKALEALYGDLPALLSQSASKNSFNESLKTKFATVGTPKVGASRNPISPAFDIHLTRATTGDEEMEVLQNNLKSKTPTSILVCADQLMKDPNFRGGSVPPFYTNSCGSHAITVVGMKQVNGICKIELRNSWGTSWPSAEGKGHIWLPATQLLSTLLATDRSSEMVSITSREANEPIQNTIKTQEYDYQGETFRANFSGHGRYNGSFPGGSRYSGEMLNSKISGKGHLVQPNGAILDGTFQDGTLMNGHFTGIINDTTGQYYDGPMVNGFTTADGRFSNTR